MRDLQQSARLALACMDLTNLKDSNTDSDIEALCRQAKTPLGNTAAVCVKPAFVVTAKRALSAENGPNANTVKVATVTNFPHGNDDPMAAARETRSAVAAGADEVEVVFPYRALLAGDEATGLELVEMCRAAAVDATLKVILETSELVDPTLIGRAAELAIEGGADVITSSTGKVDVSATLDAAEIILETIKASPRKNVGFKVAGGIYATEQAHEHLMLAADIMGPAWVTPAHFRFGSSELLDSLLDTLQDSMASI
ncbi:deoxyribose-phosphate aldolase [Halomonas halocynthiae]|uniref:deoxyribose-phosphate aldolase n=1 Tax=Halomonas halocynthiae TaxID=176290 RepID=UPI00040E3889|nr:deoxyribose-phosphate aldolase [Halomonas halocynthiae]